MKKMINSTTIMGRIYQHDLQEKTVQNEKSENFGKTFIAGTLEIATDEEGLNVIPVHYTYVTEKTKSGGKNGTYTTLKKIIDGDKNTWVTGGKDSAVMVQCDTALGLNEFYASTDDSLVSQKVNEGGFVKIINKLDDDVKKRSHFSLDILINNVAEIEADEEKNRPAKVVVRGAVFNFRNDLMPVELTVCEAGQKYFLDLGADSANPVFTKVWGYINCASETVTTTEESAFGEAAVTTRERKTKDWVITGTATEPYDFGDENILTADEVKKAMQDREVHLATIKKNQEEWKAQKNSNTNAATPAAVASKIPAGDFKF